MHSAVQTGIVTIISYKPLSGLNFARCTAVYVSYMPSSPLGVYKPLFRPILHAHVKIMSPSAPKSPMNYIYLFFQEENHALSRKKRPAPHV